MKIAENKRKIRFVFYFPQNEIRGRHFSNLSAFSETLLGEKTRQHFDL